jgi:hypothetical protein
VLDLRDNLISFESMKNDLIPSLKSNKTLTNLDLRENPGYSSKVRTCVALYLLKNIDLLKRGDETDVALIGKNWLNPACLLPRGKLGP